MLHTKFQGHQPVGSGEGRYFKVLPYMGMAAISVMVRPFEGTFVPPDLYSLHIKFGFNGPSRF